MAKGDKKEILERIKRKAPVFVGEIPVSLEEIFMAEMKEAGYDIRKVFM